MTRYLLTLATLALFARPIQAQPRYPLKFAPGAVQAVVSGHLKAWEKRTYVLNARAGQQLTADLDSDNTGTRFGDNGMHLGYTTRRGENYVMIWNNGRAVSNYRLKVTIR